MFSAIANIENVASDFGAIYSVATYARRSGCIPRRDFVGALVMALFFCWAAASRWTTRTTKAKSASSIDENFSAS
jgi:hypothetical protein